MHNNPINPENRERGKAVCIRRRPHHHIMKTRNGKLMAGFLVPSLLGIVLFMVPIKYNDNWTIVVKILADMIGAALGDYLPLL
jgi:hypothetical protein